MLTMLRRLRRPRDRIISNIQEIKTMLRRLSTQASIRVMVWSPQKIQFCEQEIRAATIDGIEFTILFDIAEILQSGATFDVVILCCHVQGGEEAALFKLRQHDFAKLYGVWFWDNHHHHGANLRVAALADVVFVSHWHERQYLNLPTALPGVHVPAYSNQWSAGAIARHYPAGLPAERQDALFGGFGRYGWAGERNRFIEAVSAACPEHHLTLGKIGAYFSASAAERLGDWVQHKVHLVVPINRDVSTRVFEALMTGQIPLLPDDVPDLDLVIEPQMQAVLPILRYKAGDVESAMAGWRQGIALFNRDGAAGVRRRHEFARDRHSLAARLGDFAGFLRSPGPFKLGSNGRHQFWGRWR